MSGELVVEMPARARVASGCEMLATKLAPPRVDQD